MSEDEVLRMVAKLREDVSGPLKRIELGLRGVGKRGAQESKALRDGFRKVQDEFKRVSEVAKVGVTPAFEAIGLSSLTAVGAVAALTAGLKNFADQGADVAAFGRRVQLTADTIRGLEGVAEKFQVDPNAIRQAEQSLADLMFGVRRHAGAAYGLLKAKNFDLSQQLAVTPETTAGNEQALKSLLSWLDTVKKVHGEPDARMWSREIFGNEAFVDMLRDGKGALDDYLKTYLKLTGSMDTDAGQRWIENWSNFKATLEGVRNAIGNDLLPTLTELAKEGEQFFAANKVEIAKDLTEAIRGVGVGLKDLTADMPRIEHFFDRMAKVWHYLNMTPGELVTAAMGGRDSPFYKPHFGMSDSDYYATQDGGAPVGYHTGRGRFGNYLKTGGIPTGAAEVIKGLRDRGLDAEHAAILGGNIEQESNFDPTAFNAREGAVGLIQWRLERREALQHLARLRHKSETDFGTQLDFLMLEFKSTPAGQAFLAAHGAEEENSALRGFIRYGDGSEGRRLFYGKRLLPLAEDQGVGTLLAAMGKDGLGGAAQSFTGGATIDVNVKAPLGTTVTANTHGLFDRVTVNRGFVMPEAGVGK